MATISDHASICDRANSQGARAPLFRTQSKNTPGQIMRNSTGLPSFNRPPLSRLMARTALLLLASTASMGFTSAALAQIAPTREEILREPAPTATGRAVATIDTEDGIERAPCPLANPEYADVRFTLRTVEFTGNPAIDREILTPAFADLVGTSIPVAAICDIRDRAGTILRRAGYLAAVRVPVQTISDGTVQLDLLAAHMAAVQVRGNAGPSERQLQRYLSHLQGEPLFNARDAERYLILASTLPGIGARMTVRPGGAPGDIVGEVTVDRTPIFLDTNIQNFGSHSVGRWGGIVRARFNGLTGMGDETSLSVYSTADTDEQQVVQAAHEFRVGGEGLTLSTSLTYAWTSPTLPANVPIKSRTLVWSSQARYPITLRQSHALWIGGGFDWIDQDVELARIPLNRDHLRIGWAKLDASWSDPAAYTGRSGYSPAEPAWSTNISVEARQGIDAMGASNPCGPLAAACFAPGAIPISQIEGDPSALVLRASGEWVVRPVPTFAVAVQPRVQWAPHALLSYEEFSAGNFTTGRAYDPGTLTGDSGVSLAIEARLGTEVPRNRHAFAFQPFLFVDSAWVWNEDSAANGLDPQRLASAGGGLRVIWGDKARLDIAIAEPLRRAGLQTARGATRLLVSLTTQFGAGR